MLLMFWFWFCILEYFSESYRVFFWIIWSIFLNHRIKWGPFFLFLTSIFWILSIFPKFQSKNKRGTFLSLVFLFIIFILEFLVFQIFLNFWASGVFGPKKGGRRVPRISFFFIIILMLSIFWHLKCPDILSILNNLSAF